MYILGGETEVYEEICKFYRAKDEDNKECYFHLGEGICKREEFFRCPVYQMIFEGKFSHSELNTLMFCKRLYYYKYILGIEVRPEMLPSRMKIGKIIHHGIMVINRLEDPVKRREEIIRMAKEYQLEGKEFVAAAGVLEMYEKLIGEGKIKKEDGRFEFRFEVKKPGYPVLTGVFDILYDDHFVEIKTTTNPEYYQTPHFIQSQCASYFLYSPHLKYCDMKIIRVPQLREKKDIEEGEEEFYERIRADIERRPGYYFIGLEDGDFKKRFFRSEFDLDEVLERYAHMVRERRLSIKRKFWPKNELNCLYPYQCLYLPICESGKVSDLMYVYREKEKDDDLT
jgi:CRISPR/Cas system-associated exonuclease Cas4 (RecB family)